MQSFENATKFFHACESLQGWAECKNYVANGATFSAQCEPLVDIKTVEDYSDWMAGFGSTIVPGCSYELNASSYNADTNTAMFFGTFTGIHTGEGGPVPPTNKQTKTQYVYILTMNAEGMIEEMVKVWNAPWALKELGWM
jgi:hypothetical protein